MSIVAEFTVPTSRFALAAALPESPDVEVEFERVVSHSQEWVMPFLWVRGDDLGGFTEAAEADPTVRSITVTDEFDGAALYRMQWSDDIKAIVNDIFNRSGTLVEASGRTDTWTLSVRFQSKSAFSDLRDHFDTEGEPFEVERLYRQTKPRQPEYSLTKKQRDMLLFAIEEGYYEVPQRASVDELAEAVGVSTTAVSERLRRAVTTLVEDTLLVGAGDQLDEIDVE